MSYYKSRETGTSQFGRIGGFVTEAKVISLITQTGKTAPDFYELEEAEVFEVLLEEEDLPEINGQSDWSYYGAVRARMVNSQKNKVLDVIEEIDFLYKPLDLNSMRYPLVGEYVIVVEYLGTWFYTNVISLNSGINHNVEPGASISRVFPSEPEFEDDFTEITNIRQVKVKSGDTIFQGRYGNSIRFSSDVDGHPTIKIRVGQGDISDNPNEPIEENLDQDKSSIWFDVNSITIDSKNIQYGPKFDNQPMVLGQVLVDILGELLEEINILLGSLQSFSNNAVTITAAVAVGAPGPAVGTALATLALDIGRQVPNISAISSKFETILSTEQNITS